MVYMKRSSKAPAFKRVDRRQDRDLNKLKREVSRLKGDVEWKFNTPSYGENLTSTGVVKHLTDIAQGTTATSRVGNKISLERIRMEGHVHSLDTVGGKDLQQVRLILVQDTQQVADTGPSVTDILENADPDSLFDYTFTSQSPGGDRFAVIFDKRFKLRPAVHETAAGTYTYFRDMKILRGSYRPKRRSVYYNGSASTEIQKNGLYLLMIANTNTAAYAELNFNVKYSDA